MMMLVIEENSFWDCVYFKYIEMEKEIYLTETPYHTN